MNKRIRTTILATAVAGGTVLGATQLGGIANAQIDDGGDTPVDAPESPPEDEDGRPPRGEGRRGAHLDSLAELLGMDADALREALLSDSTLADVAADQGVDVEVVVEAIVDQKTERIEQAVEDGRLTEDEAAEKTADLEERVTTRVNEGRPEGDRGPRGPRGPRDGGEPPADVASTEDGVEDDLGS